MASPAQKLAAAAKKGNLEQLKILTALCNRKENTSALQHAAAKGHLQCVEFLIPKSTPKADDSWALQMAARYGHMQCVELLIPVSNPKAADSQALRGALENGQTHCVELLCDVSDSEQVLVALKDFYFDEPEMWTFLEDTINAKRQHNLLTQEISSNNTSKRRAKI